MRLGTGRLLLCAGIVLGILAAAAPAIAAPRTLAYLDPGTGSQQQLHQCCIFSPGRVV